MAKNPDSLRRSAQDRIRRMERQLEILAEDFALQARAVSSKDTAEAKAYSLITRLTRLQKKADYILTQTQEQAILLRTLDRIDTYQTED